MGVLTISRAIFRFQDRHIILSLDSRLILRISLLLMLNSRDLRIILLNSRILRIMLLNSRSLRIMLLNMMRMNTLNILVPRLIFLTIYNSFSGRRIIQMLISGLMVSPPIIPILPLLLRIVVIFLNSFLLLMRMLLLFIRFSLGINNLPILLRRVRSFIINT